MHAAEAAWSKMYLASNEKVVSKGQATIVSSKICRIALQMKITMHFVLLKSAAFHTARGRGRREEEYREEQKG